MIKGKVNVSSSGDRFSEIRRATAALAQEEVLVGIPEGRASRSGEINNAELTYIQTHGVRSKGMASAMDEMLIGPDGVPHSLGYDKFQTNLEQMPYPEALQLYIHENGSPAWRIPPRPIIEPAIADPENREEIVAQMRRAASSAASGNATEAKIGARRVGMVAQNAVRMWFISPKNRWPALSPRTIRRKGSDRPLIDTGQLRRAITYVVRQRGGGTV